jgi:hypothetical protein
LLDRLPESISTYPERLPRYQRYRYAIAFLCVACFWWILGLWWERLFAGRRLPPERKALRWSILALAGILFTIAGLAMYTGSRDGREGPATTDAAILLPALLTIMTLAECGLRAGVLKGVGARVALPTAFLCLFIWSDTEFRAERLEREAQVEWENAHRWTVDRYALGEPQVLEGLWLPFPPVLLTESASITHPSGTPLESTAAKVWEYLLVGLYWYAIVALAQRKWPATTRVYNAIRPWLAVPCVILFCLAFFSWMTVSAAQFGGFGFVIGMAVLIYTLHVSRASGHPSHLEIDAQSQAR